MQKKGFWILIIFLLCLAANVFSQKMTVEDSDGNVLMEVTDEDTAGSIMLPLGAAPGTTTNKLYNVGGSLYWSGTALGIGASNINGLSDGRVLGSSVYLGSGAGANHSTGDLYNVAVGMGALSANTAGFSNTAGGFQALQFNTEGDYNTASGTFALQFNTTGQYNTAFGYWALYSNTTGNNNTTIGIQANRFNEAGSNNTIIGFRAGMGTSAHNKSGNVFLGYQAGYNETGSNKLYIENSNSATPLIGGDFSANRVDINGQIKITGGSPVAGEVLTSDGDGLATWETVSTGVSDINGLSDGKTIGSSVYLGSNAGGLHTSGSLANVAVGELAMYNNTGGEKNTAIGNAALILNLGAYNMASGYSALCNNITGNSNTASGYEALKNNIYGSKNTAVGYGANVNYANLTNSTAIGAEALVYVSNNVRIGNELVTHIYGQVGWTATSDSTKKENVFDVDGDEVLNKIRDLRLSSWNFKDQDAKTCRHYGPMAQAFYRAFGHDGFGTVGNETTICTSDMAGINMIAIQALEKRTAQLKEENEQILAENKNLKAELEHLKMIVANLCERIGGDKVKVSSADSR
jgi:trimeric autotransporter adhesin